MGREMLRCAQHDSAVTHTDSWINLLNFIIVPTADLSAPQAGAMNWAQRAAPTLHLVAHPIIL